MHYSVIIFVQEYLSRLNVEVSANVYADTHVSVMSQFKLGGSVTVFGEACFKSQASFKDFYAYEVELICFEKRKFIRWVVYF